MSEFKLRDLMQVINQMIETVQGWIFEECAIYANLKMVGNSPSVKD